MFGFAVVVVLGEFNSDDAGHSPTLNLLARFAVYGQNKFVGKLQED